MVYFHKIAIDNIYNFTEINFNINSSIRYFAIKQDLARKIRPSSNSYSNGLFISLSSSILNNNLFSVVSRFRYVVTGILNLISTIISRLTLILVARTKKIFIDTTEKPEI